MSIITKKFLNYLGVPVMKINEESTRPLQMANGQMQKPLGVAILQVNIEGVETPYKFTVLPFMSQELVLGNDFMEEFQCQINFLTRSVSFFNGGVTLDVVSPVIPIERAVMLINSCTLEPMSETIVNVYCREAINDTIFLEPKPRSPKQQFVVAKALVKPKNGVTVCKILNPTNDVVTLAADRVIATIESVDTEEISNCEKALKEIKEEGAEGDYEECERIVKDLGVTIEQDNLTEAQHRKLVQLLALNRNVFAKSLNELEGTDVIVHEIDTGDSPPIRLRSYRHSPEAKIEIERQVKDMLESGIIEPSDSPWSAPVLLVKKKSGEMRFCVDFRRLNAVTKPINFPLPLISDVVDSLSHQPVKFLSSLDLRSGYWQLKMAPNSMDKVSFSVNNTSHFRFRRMPFGLSNASQTFSICMAKVFRGMTLKSVISYLDDVLVYSASFEQHLTQLQEVFDRLMAAKLKLHPSKCSFARHSVKFLGHVISPEGIAVDEDKVKVVRTYPTPRTVRDVRAWLGYSGYYRRFVKGYSKIAAPLHELLKKENEFNWTKQCDDAFEQLRQALMTAPVLAFPDMSKEFILNTDASTEAIGFVLSQIGDDNLEHPIAYNGRALRGSEKNWSITELEALALVVAIKEFHPYLAMRRFTVYTDHISLSWLREIKQHNGRLLRWSIMLQSYDFQVVYKTGKTNQNADALSRRSYGSPPPEDPFDDITNDDIHFGAVETTEATEWIEIRFDWKGMDDELQVTNSGDINRSDLPLPVCIINEAMDEHGEEEISQPKGEYQTAGQNDTQQKFEATFNEELSEKQRKDYNISRIIQYMENGELPQDAKSARQTVIEAEFFFFKDGILHHRQHESDKRKQAISAAIEQVVIPEDMRIQVLEQYHDNNGHPAVERCYAAIRQHYYWHRMYADIRRYARSCTVCQRSHINYGARKPPLQPLPVQELFERWHMDILGPLANTPEGYKYVLVVVESLSRHPELIPLKTQEASEVAEALWKHIFSRFGAPRSLVSDRGTNFLSHLVANLCKLFNVTRIHTSAHHQQSNAACEKFNDTILKCLRCYCENQEDWPTFLPAIAAAYRCTPCTSSTDMSPFMVMYGRHMLLPLDISLVAPENGKHRDADEYIRNMLPKLETMREIARQKVQERQDVYKKQYDKHTKPTDLQPGTLVLLYNPSVPMGKVPKMYRKFRGPYYIVSKEGEVNYRLRECGTNKEISYPVHADRLKRYYDTRDDFQPGARNQTTDNQNENEASKVQSGSGGGNETNGTNGTNENKRNERSKRNKRNRTNGTGTNGTDKRNKRNHGFWK